MLLALENDSQICSLVVEIAVDNAVFCLWLSKLGTEPLDYSAQSEMEHVGEKARSFQ
jgi:hypothetical protein